MRFVRQLDDATTPRGHTRDALKRLILARDYHVGDKLPTYRELADHFGVALFTVERVMKELAREGVVHLLHGKGAFLRQLPAAAGQLRQVGLIYSASRLHLVRNAYLTEILAGIVQQCDLRQIDLQILSFWQAGRRVPVPPHETALRIDGAILLGLFNDAYIAEFAREEIPLVLVDARCEAASVHSIATDNALAVDQTMDHLHALGHARIAYLDVRSYDSVTGQWTDGPDSRERRLAYLAAMQRLGLSAHQCIYQAADAAPDQTVQVAARRLLQELHPPTAILAYDAFVAGDLCRELCKAGRRVPQDISIAGVAASQQISSVDGHVVTCSRVLFEDMGNLAMKSLVNQAGGRILCKPILDRIGVNLSIGTTTAPPQV